MRPSMRPMMGLLSRFRMPPLQRRPSCRSFVISGGRSTARVWWGASTAGADGDCGDALVCFTDLLEGTSTHENLKQAFAEEAMAAFRYEYFAQVADRDGYADVAQTFRSLAHAERAHCMRWLEQLTTINDPLTAEPVGDTFSNLHAAITSELHDNKDMYPKMAATAKTEGTVLVSPSARGIGCLACQLTHMDVFVAGFEDLAQAFVDTAHAEGRHAKKLQVGKVFSACVRCFVV